MITRYCIEEPIQGKRESKQKIKESKNRRNRSRRSGKASRKCDKPSEVDDRERNALPCKDPTPEREGQAKHLTKQKTKTFNQLLNFSFLSSRRIMLTIMRFLAFCIGNKSVPATNQFANTNNSNRVRRWHRYEKLRTNSRGKGNDRSKYLVEVRSRLCIKRSASRVFRNCVCKCV